MANRSSSTNNPPTPRDVSRIDSSDTLLQSYLTDRKAWEIQRDAMIKDSSEKAFNDPKVTEEFARTLAHRSAIEEARLNSKHTDAVVRNGSMLRGSRGGTGVDMGVGGSRGGESFLDSALKLNLKARDGPVRPGEWFDAVNAGVVGHDQAVVESSEDVIARLRGVSGGGSGR